MLAVALALGLAGCASSHASPATTTSRPPTTTQATTTASAVVAPPRPHPRVSPPFPVAERTFTFIDPSRLVRYPGQGSAPRKLVTLVRYPRGVGTFPLVVFGHGFAVTPRPYAALLEAWARAGYVVAAPVFPLGNANAPGGPNESDLVNQPRDMSFVITRLLGLSARRGGPLAGVIDPRRIAVSGQSDGGDTALTVAYASAFRDRRIGAAAILSGQEIPGVGGYDFPRPSPPLLAVQGLADTINLPSTTFQFFDAAPAPKYLLKLPGAPHLGPYTDEQPQLGIVERVTIAFFDAYLKRMPGARGRLAHVGNVPGTAILEARAG